jgi:hypothetical protein
MKRYKVSKLIQQGVNNILLLSPYTVNDVLFLKDFGAVSPTEDMVSRMSDQSNSLGKTAAKLGRFRAVAGRVNRKRVDCTRVPGGGCRDGSCDGLGRRLSRDHSSR